MNCITAEIQVHLRHPAPIDEPLVIVSSIIKKTRKLVESKAAISLKDNTLIAEGTATQFVINPKEGDTINKEGKA